MTPVEVAWRPGGCHCGAVRFEAALADNVEARSCSCSICAMTGFLHLIVRDADFRLNHGEDLLTSYRFNTGAAQHLFCSRCGVKGFYRPRSHPDDWSVNARCLDPDATLTIARGEPFDGRNWEAYFASLGSDGPEPKPDAIARDRSRASLQDVRGSRYLFSNRR